MEPLKDQAVHMIMQFGGGEEEHGASTDKVCNNDPEGDHNASIRSTHKKGHAGLGKRKGTCRQVP
jgi:hypothetical protein